MNMSKAIFFLGLILLVFGCSPGTKKQEVSGKAKDPNSVKNSDSAESADTCPKNICGESESCEIFTQQNSNYETSEIAFLFQLKYPALTGNIEIYIDGVLVPQGDWNYLQDQNAIRIGADAFLKEEGSVVKVTYNTTEAINENCVGNSNPPSIERPVLPSPPAPDCTKTATDCTGTTPDLDTSTCSCKCNKTCSLYLRLNSSSCQCEYVYIGCSLVLDAGAWWENATTIVNGYVSAELTDTTASLSSCQTVCNSYRSTYINPYNWSPTKLNELLNKTSCSCHYYDGTSQLCR